MHKTIYRSAAVVIPSYNESDYLLPCLEALHRQTLPPDEIIVVDNNSTDDSIAQAQRLFPDVRYLHESRQGIVFAREAGFTAASSDVIVKIDADTMVDVDWLERLLQSMNDQNADAWSGYLYCSEVSRVMRSSSLQYVLNVVLFAGTHLSTGCRFLVGSNLAISRSAWQRIQPHVHMRNDIWEDMDMALALAQQKQKVITSTRMTVSISARALNTNPRGLYTRLYGQPRALRLHRRWVAYSLSLTYTHLLFLIWILWAPVARIGQKWTKRTRPEQV